jgi:hypothetical protein
VKNMTPADATAHPTTTPRRGIVQTPISASDGRRDVDDGAKRRDDGGKKAGDVAPGRPDREREQDRRGGDEHERLLPVIERVPELRHVPRVPRSRRVRRFRLAEPPNVAGDDERVELDDGPHTRHVAELASRILFLDGRVFYYGDRHEGGRAG